MDETKSILHELYVYCEWKPEPEYIQKPDGLLPENISTLWRWMKFLGPKKSLIDSVTAFKERQQKWHLALGDEGKVIAVLSDNILEIRTKRSDYATIAARTTVNRDAYAQWRKLVWSPDCTFVALAYGNGVVSFFDLTASNLFNIPIDCSRPGGLECTDNTHAVADIIFMPLRVKDTKWSWEVLIVNYDGKVRGFLVSQMDGFSLHHTITFGGGIAAVAYCDLHATLYVAGVPKGGAKDPDSAHTAGLTAWRVLNDEPHYKLSVVSDHLEGQGNDKWNLYIPLLSSKNLAFIVQMCLSPDASKLVCIHCNGDISIWRLPLLKLMSRFPLASQPGYDVQNPLVEAKPGKKDVALFYPADVSWWSDEEVIVSRFSGSVSVCSVSSLRDRLTRGVFVLGAGRVRGLRTRRALALECDQKTITHNNSDIVKQDEEPEEGMLDLLKELVKYVVFAITDIESLAPRPRRVSTVARVYRLLAINSTTPNDLFARKIESGNYADALSLAETFNLDSDQVYQQQWRKNPVSTEAIDKYLSKVSKKIWAVHQCVDRLPETLPAANELLHFGLQLTNEKILEEINKDRDLEEQIMEPEDIEWEHLNAFTSELLRCRHVMLFYKERLALYESIIKYEKSTYVKDEYDRLRSNSIMRSSIEIAKEGRIEALTCLWPHIKTLGMKLAVLENLPETINPMDYQHLLPTMSPVQWFETKSPIKVAPSTSVRDWCRKEIFRSIWSSNWSEEPTPENEGSWSGWSEDGNNAVPKWYATRARAIESRAGLVSHALTLTSLATLGAGVEGLETLMFHLMTLDTLLYDRHIETVTLDMLENMTVLDTCGVLMKTSTEETFVSDLNTYVLPFLKRYEVLCKKEGAASAGLVDYLESISVEDLTPVLMVLQTPGCLPLSTRTQLELAERCLLAYTATDHLTAACDLIHSVLKDTDGSISVSELVVRARVLQRVVVGAARLGARGLVVPPRALRAAAADDQQARALLTALARSLAQDGAKPTAAEWDKLLRDILELQSTLFDFITKEQCHEIYLSALLTSGDAASIRLAGGVAGAGAARLALSAAREYFNSASALDDPALQLARCCLTLIREENQEIKEELDLISALQILQSFNLNIIPIQVRLCENKMTLIEDCLKSEPSAYLASHKLLKLAALLRIGGDDELAREGTVLELVCSAALSGGAAGAAAAGAAARRLAALRRAPRLLAAAARLPAPAHHTRHLLAAAAAACDPADIEDILKRRLALELEGLEAQGATPAPARCPSTDDEFADAITTPVIEKKDLVAPPQNTKLPLFNYLMDTFQSKFSSGDNKSPSSEPAERAAHVPEFYHSLYEEATPSDSSYRYSQFSQPDALTRARAAIQLLNWFYVRSSVDDTDRDLTTENKVLSECINRTASTDTALCAALCLRAAAVASEDAVTSQDSETSADVVPSVGVTPAGLTSAGGGVALAAALYGALIRDNASDLRDNVYLTKPAVLAELSLKKGVGAEGGLIGSCMWRLAGAAELAALRARGLRLSGPLFSGDADYRREVIYRLARSGEVDQLPVAYGLAKKYGIDPMDVWVEAALAAPDISALTRDTLPDVPPAHAHARILADVYPSLAGTAHAALAHVFGVLRALDDKPLIHSLPAADHIKLLKKARAVSTELDYKVVIEQSPLEPFCGALLGAMRADNAGMVCKFLRALPPAVKLPLAVSALYTKWLTKYFFSVSSSNPTSKKWMQQYRQCASYFNKLSKEELLKFVNETCFSDMAIERVPAGTRNLMIMQAVDYCQQEQENDFKYNNKNGQTWAQTGQELSRWARFLENYHSPPVRDVIETSGLQHHDIWVEIEKTHGSRAPLIAALWRAARALRPAALRSLVACLGAAVSEDDVRAYRPGASAAPPGDAASARGRVPGRIVEVFRRGWPHEPYALELTEELLSTEAGQRAALRVFLPQCDTPQRLSALAEALASWSPTRDIEPRSVHCEFLRALLSEHLDQKSNWLYIKILFKRPLLNMEEIKYLADSATGESAINIIWIILYNKSIPIHAHHIIIKLLQDHREVIQKQEIEDILIKELLDNGMLLPLVPTVLYPCVVKYVIEQSSIDHDDSEYTVKWAVHLLAGAGRRAEAGHLQLMAHGVPPALRGFSETVRFTDNMDLFKY